mmetsp:Transcript_30913/g.56015  ORF Transcript_30913/g.56015 Transcript_30913/m.56015 type:complete len:247 (+) Transcript_30913:120-860(+)|eukprot:CAMPEP_0201873596 /NCGR_PEP_ID=MMETSP0902-20130614/6051_1 /ASSEMBLY_ACC=CAM_ASM_000551 /TAXON_ID=420261 /ORGANISM="Thalassiosira antarctica, Strain CCMP982" /LENGTH=246 /DNA_ID=CAMNT_0048400231 /DNA_START=105 /DNA_END=845 /DNA_ORIENTATION=-
MDETESTTAAVENATHQEEPLTTEQPSAAEQEPSKQPPPSATATTETKNTNAANIEFEPPAACIRRLLKQALPKSTNVSKDSLAAISRASGIFVLYLTACANDVAREGRRTTIVAKDVLGALRELDFEEFVPLMEKFLEGHRKEEKSKKEEKERVKKLQQQQQMLNEEKEDGRDTTTGKFVAKDGKLLGEEKGEEEAGEEADMAESVTAGESKHGREEEGESDEGGQDQPSPKKQKIDEENEDKEE